MNNLWLTNEQAKQIVEHARRETPREVCGVIAGNGNRAVKIIPVQNVDKHPTVRFTMDPHALSHILPALADEQLQLLGFYHSHPNANPIPSQSDIKEASYPDVLTVIVSLKQAQPHIAAWKILHTEITRVSLHIGAYQPLLEDREVSSTQKTAIILTGIIAFVLFVLFSVQLLPAPPPIP